MILNSISKMGLKDKKWASLSRAPTFLFLLLALSGCDWKEFFRPQGGPPKSVDLKSTSADPGNGMMTAAEKLKMHRWIVTEMQEQIFAKPAKSPSDVEGWANVLSQRGSIEGVYHGLILSSEYAALEKGRTATKAVRFFAQEMAALDFPNLPDGSKEIRDSQENYAREYLNAPLFTLKKILGEKVLKEAITRSSDRVGLAAWYSSFAARWIKAGVSFGIPQRDRAEESFHFTWAQENSLGMIQWELLNRVHRVLNEYGGVAAPAKASAAPAPTPTPAGR